MLTIGEVASQTGLSVHALRFWERAGVLADPVARAPGGRRLYCADDLEWLQLCIIMRASGMSLAALRAYTELVRAGDGNELERLALLRGHRDEVLARIARLHECLDLITYKVGIYEDLTEDQSTAASSTAGR